MGVTSLAHNPSAPTVSSSQGLKKALQEHGFEIFRTLPEEIVLADRVRENLILDSGVRVAVAEDGIRIRLTMRAQKADFPHDDEATLFERVRGLSTTAIDGGFLEIASEVNIVRDPSDPRRVLDVFYELQLAREVGSIDEALPILRFALGLEKAAGHS